MVDAEAWRRHILTSAIKRFDEALVQLIEEYAAGGSLAPDIRHFGLASGMVDISYSGGFLEDVRPQLEALRAQIIAGQIEVPCYPAERVLLAAQAEFELPPC